MTVVEVTAEERDKYDQQVGQVIAWLKLSKQELHLPITLSGKPFLRPRRKRWSGITGKEK